MFRGFVRELRVWWMPFRVLFASCALMVDACSNGGHLLSHIKKKINNSRMKPEHFFGHDYDLLSRAGHARLCFYKFKFYVLC